MLQMILDSLFQENKNFIEIAQIEEKIDEMGTGENEFCTLHFTYVLNCMSANSLMLSSIEYSNHLLEFILQSLFFVHKIYYP